MRLLFVILITLCNAATFAQTQKKNCLTMDNVVRNTLRAIEQHDTALYLSMVDMEHFVASLEKGMKDDSVDKAFFIELKDDPARIQLVFKIGLIKLWQKIEEELPGQKLNIQFKSSRIVNEEKAGNTTHYSIEAYVDVNETRRSLLMYASKINDCFYILEPIAPYFNKD